MAPNPHVAKAFRAMKELGISEQVVKPVLKKLLKVYESNWVLIESENYRVLADAIFDVEETEAVEQKKKTRDTDQDEYFGEGTQLRDDARPPLKRLRLIDQEIQHPLSFGTPNDMMDSDVPDLAIESSSRQLRPRGKKPAPPLAMTAEAEEDDSPSLQLRPREKGKEPISPRIHPRDNISEKSANIMLLKEPKPEPGIAIVPKKKVVKNSALTKPRDEPTDDTVLNEIPIAILPPDKPRKVNPSVASCAQNRASCQETPASQCVDGEGKDDSVRASSSAGRNILELENIPTEYSPEIEVASSPLGEVKISLSCKPAIGNPNFHMPSLEAVLKSVEDKCLRTYRISGPNFSMMNLMRDMCDSFLELGNQSTTEWQDKTTDVEIDSLEIFSGEPGLTGTDETSIVVSNGSINVGVALPEILRLPPSINGVVDRLSDPNHEVENGFCEIGKEKGIKNSADGKSHKTMDKKKKKGVDEERSCSLVIYNQNELTADQMRSLFDRNDITRGEEIVQISLVNEINEDQPPSFHYIPKNLAFQNAYVNFSLARIGDEDCCSTCFGDCLSSAIPCACARETGGEFAYTKDGLVKEQLLEECISMNRDPEKHKHFYCKECPLEKSVSDGVPEPCKGHLMRKFIKECWSKCGCNKQCANRVVQRGITCKLQIFMTAGKGWGIRTLEDLPKGAFVFEYVGEILTNSELYERNTRSTGSHSYPVLLDADWGAENVLKDEEALCLDATHIGNVARFLNHRCLDANMVEIPVEVETPDHHYYHLAFFTTRKVDAMEEMTWDYGIDFDDHDHPVKAFRCKCGSKFCRNMKRSNRSRSGR